MVNDKLVGKNCLTLIHNTEHDRVRYKFHNKFIQSIEIPGVGGKIGLIWLYNPNELLTSIINNSLETDLVRLEISFYENNNAVSEEYISIHLNYLIELLPQELI